MYMIEDEDDIDELLVHFSNSNSSVWRGQNESKYKLYTSMQREWIRKNRPQTEVIEYIDFLKEYTFDWGNGIFNKHAAITNGNEPPGIFAILALLRHYDVAMPFTDWTVNPLIALYFAIDKVEHGKVGCNEIEDYVSVYQIDENHDFYKFDAKQYLVSDSEWNKIKNTFARSGHTIEQFSKSLKVALKEPSEQYLRKVFSERAFLSIANNPDVVLVFRVQDSQDDSFKWGIINNLNILSQQGLFMFNIDPKLPLEDVPPRLMNHLENVGSLTKQVPQHIRQQRVEQMTAGLVCFNINKRLVPKINSMLHSRGITKHTVFPDFNNLATKAIKAVDEHFKS